MRLEQGDFSKVKVYGSSPLEFAKKWASLGAELIHIVDLDGAKYGEPKNFDAIKMIAAQSGVKVEVGGGIRTVASIKAYMDAGIDRVVLSTKVLQDPDFLAQNEIRNYIDRIVLSLDIKYSVRGADKNIYRELSGVSDENTILLGIGAGAWSDTENIDLPGFMKKISVIGIKYVNFSDIKRDGMMAGPNLQQIKDFVGCVKKASLEGFFLTYAGGVSSLEDIKVLSGLKDEGVNAVIVGRALYENRFNLQEAIRIAQGSRLC